MVVHNEEIYWIQVTYQSNSKVINVNLFLGFSSPNLASTEATPSEVSHQTEDSKTMTETSTIPERDPQSETESERYKVALQDLRKRTLLRMLNEDRDERLHQLQADTRMDLQQREQVKPHPANTLSKKTFLLFMFSLSLCNP